jgi:hypothetical protein
VCVLNRLQYLSVSYEAWFQCGGYVNSQNYGYQSTENPMLIHKVPLHDVKNGMQYAESNWGIMGPIFFFWDHKFTLMLHTLWHHFFTYVLLQEIVYPFAAWQRNSWSHKEVLCIIYNVIHNRTICSRSLPPHLINLNLCHQVSLLGMLKDKG